MRLILQKAHSYCVRVFSCAAAIVDSRVFSFKAPSSRTRRRRVVKTFRRICINIARRAAKRYGERLCICKSIESASGN
jgi:hypothetical protein